MANLTNGARIDQALVGPAYTHVLRGYFLGLALNGMAVALNSEEGGGGGA